jgi:hypothetical protein
MNASPRPGDRILLVSADEVKEVIDLYRFILERFKLRITVESTMEGTVKALIQPFDLVWLRLPLPDLSAHHLLEELLAARDLAGRVGTESPVNVLDRLTSISWYTKLSRQSLRKAPDEEFLKRYRDFVEIDKQFRHKHDGQWLWIRMSTDEERAWVIQLLERNMTHDHEST